MSERQYAPTQSVATTEQIEATPQPTQAPSTEMNTSSPAASSPLVRATAQPNLGMTEGGQPARAPAEREVAPSESAEQAPQPEQEGEGTPATAEQNGEGSAPAESEAPAVPSISRNPQDNPQFNQSMQKLKKGAKTVKTHEPAGKKVEAAKKAAKEPANAKAAGAKAKQVNKMQSADTDKKVDKSSFLELLRSEIEKVMPKKVEEGRDYMKGNDKKQLKSGLSAGISSEKEKTTASIDSTTQEQPDESNVEEKETTPLPEEESPQPPQGIGADKAIPPERSEEEVKPDKESAQEELDKNDLDQPQLEKANDPRFNAVVEAKNEADTYADTVPDSYRANEQTIRESTSVQGARNASRDLVSMGNTRVEADTTVQQAQGTQISSDEAARQKVSNDIEAIYQKTKTDVETQLSTLETDVNSVFDKGVDKAIKDMKDYVEDRFDKRYSGVRGKARWVKDKLLPLPDFVKAWFDQAHQQFRRDLDAVVVRVADMVESRLKKAKDRIDEGQTAIEKYVSTLEGDLKKYGETAATDVKGRFDDLRSSVDDKRKQLASSLAQRYKEAVDKGAQALQELKDAHKSLVERIRDAIVAVVKILREFKERIMSLLKKAAATIRLIIKDPIGFLKNILNAIKQGLRQFVSNIWKHLKAGFLGWMFGALGDAGLQMPAEFNLAGILSIVLQVLGLTYDRIRAKAVRLIGERNVAIIEKVADILHTLFTQGPAALWEQLKEYLSNLKEIVINAIQEWVVTKIITAAITKLVSMFNPVGAIIQAIITIYNVVMFLIERMPQILAFVQSVIDSIDNIVRGKIGAAANFIEQALARTLPIIISFLARLLGLGGISEKIKGIIKKIQQRVDKALDNLIKKIVNSVKRFLGKDKGRKDDEQGDAKALARQTMEDRISGTHSIGEIKDIARKTEQELRKKGVKKIKVGRKSSDGVFPIQIEASELSDELFLQVVEGKGKAAVTLHATIDFTAPQTITPSSPYTVNPARIKMRDPQDRRRNIYPTLQDPDQPDKQVSLVSVAPGVVVVRPEPLPAKPTLEERDAPTSGTTLQILAKSQGGRREHRLNETHAETQFIEWFNNQFNIDDIRTVTDIHIHVSKSPCGTGGDINARGGGQNCSGDLANFANRLRIVNKAINIVVSYGAPFESQKNATTVEDIAEMEGADITVRATGKPVTLSRNPKTDSSQEADKIPVKPIRRRRG